MHEHESTVEPSMAQDSGTFSRWSSYGFRQEARTPLKHDTLISIIDHGVD